MGSHRPSRGHGSRDTSAEPPLVASAPRFCQELQTLKQLNQVSLPWPPLDSEAPQAPSRPFKPHISWD